MSAIKEDDNFVYYEGYKIPKHYSIPGLPSAPEQARTKTVQGTQTSAEQGSQKEWLKDNTTAAMITAGMVGLFGGVAIGRISRKREVKIKDGI